jgi:hypothetical protein
MAGVIPASMFTFYFFSFSIHISFLFLGIVYFLKFRFTSNNQIYLLETKRYVVSAKLTSSIAFSLSLSPDLEVTRFFRSNGTTLIPTVSFRPSVASFVLAIGLFRLLSYNSMTYRHTALLLGATIRYFG